jgi:hypothetical protein
LSSLACHPKLAHDSGERRVAGCLGRFPQLVSLGLRRRPCSGDGASAHRLCRLIWKTLHQRIRYEERGPAVSREAKNTCALSIHRRPTRRRSGPTVASSSRDRRRRRQAGRRRSKFRTTFVKKVTLAADECAKRESDSAKAERLRTLRKAQQARNARHRRKECSPGRCIVAACAPWSTNRLEIPRSTIRLRKFRVRPSSVNVPSPL